MNLDGHALWVSFNGATALVAIWAADRMDYIDIQAGWMELVIVALLIGAAMEGSKHVAMTQTGME
jgi:hypothetical protein